MIRMANKEVLKEKSFFSELTEGKNRLNMEFGSRERKEGFTFFGYAGLALKPSLCFLRLISLPSLVTPHSPVSGAASPEISLQPSIRMKQEVVGMLGGVGWGRKCLGL